MKTPKLPSEILVYQCDMADGQPIYAVALNAQEIPEEYDGVTVGMFVLNRKYKFGVKRELK